MHTLSTLLSLVLASGAVAEQLFAVDFPVVASVVGSAGGLTTYNVACTSGSDTKTCNFVQPFPMVIGPSTVSFEMTVPGEQTATLQCSLPASTSMTCSATAITPTPTPQTVFATSSFSGPSVSTYFKDVSIVSASSALCTYNPITSSASKPTASASSGLGHAANGTSTAPFAVIESGLGETSTKGAAKGTGSSIGASTAVTKIPNAASRGQAGMAGLFVGVIALVALC